MPYRCRAVRGRVGCTRVQQLQVLRLCPAARRSGHGARSFYGGQRRAVGRGFGCNTVGSARTRHVVRPRNRQVYACTVPYRYSTHVACRVPPTGAPPAACCTLSPSLPWPPPSHRSVPPARTARPLGEVHRPAGVRYAGPHAAQLWAQERKVSVHAHLDGPPPTPLLAQIGLLVRGGETGKPSLSPCFHCRASVRAGDWKVVSGPTHDQPTQSPLSIYHYR